MPKKTTGPSSQDSVICPHGCGTERDSIDAMQEHITASHPNVRRVGDAMETLGGEAALPADLEKDIERVLAGASAARTVVNKDAEMAFITEFQSGVEWKGRMLPEYITMYRYPDGMKVRVASKRMLEVMMKKKYTLRPPGPEVYDEYWFHWRCPVPGCADRIQKCDLHDELGSDSNHGLQSPEYMMLHHLQTGNQVHRAYFQINKKRLEEEMSGAFAALIASQEQEERRSERLKDEDARRMQNNAAPAAGG